MKKVLVLAVALVFVASVAYGASIVNSGHDMRVQLADETTTQVCIFCHAPHNTSSTIPVALWNHTDTQTNFTMYTSTTLQGATATQPAGISRACLTCHDGSVAVNSLLVAPRDGTAGTLTQIGALNPAANLGSNLGVHHPVSITYRSDLDTGLNANTGAAVVGPAGSLPLFGTPVAIECGSCHNVHDPANAPFLRFTNVNSQLCTTCHNK